MYKGEFKFETDPNCDYIFDEKGNTFLAMRKVKWGDSPEFKLDLRRYYSTATGERMDKGFSFLTEDGPNELINSLLKEGYGNTRDMLNTLKDRNDFMVSLVTIDGINLPTEIIINSLNNEDKKMIESWNSKKISGDLYNPRTILD
jgi:hypothetical protein